MKTNKNTENSSQNDNENLDWNRRRKNMNSFSGFSSNQPSCTYPSNQPMAMDFSSLITLLMQEIRDTLNTKIDMLNEKIELRNEENRKLKEENLKLKETITRQDEKIAEISRQQQNRPTTPTATTPANIHTTSLASKPRGIRSHNLIITYQQDRGTDPKIIAEEIFMTRFHRKPSLNSAKFLTTTRGQVTSTHEDTTRGQAGGQENATRGQTQTDSATTTENRNYKILVTMNSVWEARAIYNERVRMLKNTGIYIAEDLNRDEAYTFYLARQLKKNNKIISTWTENGDIFIREKLGSFSRILLPDDPLLQQIELPESRKPTEPNSTDPAPASNAQPETPQRNNNTPQEASGSHSSSSINTIPNEVTEPATTDSKGKAKKKTKNKKNED